jgi:DNA-binding CsgD family transcriptional regulator
MSFERVSEPPSGALSLLERAILEYFADGLSDREIAVRLGLSRRGISVIRRHAAAKLAVRIASAHPFQISEVVLGRSLDSPMP